MYVGKHYNEKFMSNFEENRTHLKLEYNDDGTATLLTDHSYYKNFDIKFDKSVVDDNLRGIDETDYYFTMLVNESKLTIHKDKWEISL